MFINGRSNLCGNLNEGPQHFPIENKLILSRSIYSISNNEPSNLRGNSK